MFYLTCVGALVPAALLAALLSRFRPQWSRHRVAISAALPGPLLMLVFGLGFAVYIFAASAPEHHAGTFGAFAVGIIACVFAAVALLAGWLAALLVTYIARR